MQSYTLLTMNEHRLLSNPVRCTAKVVCLKRLEKLGYVQRTGTARNRITNYHPGYTYSITDAGRWALKYAVKLSNG